MISTRPKNPTRVFFWLALVALAAVLASAFGSPLAPAFAASQSAIAPPITTTTIPAPPAELPVFHLPYPAGTAFLVSQGNGGAYTHNSGSDSEFAWDFDMPEGTPVVAAGDGTVVYVKQEYQGGGFTPEFAGKANYVVLKHAGGLYSLYFHLACQGVVVQEGQRVRAGQIIAMSGNTGHSTGPHLHFAVQREWPKSTSSIPVTFAEAGVPTTGSLPLSANLFTAGAPSPIATSAGLVLTGVATGPRLRTVYTHQQVKIGVEWEPSHHPVSPPGPTPPTVPVRLVAADPSGTRTVIATGSTPTGSAAGSVWGLDKLQGALTITREGWLTVWAEYDKGEGWSAVADPSGKLAFATLRVEAAEVLLAPPGIRTAPAAPPGDTPPTLTVEVGTPVSVSFALVNPGTAVQHVFRVSAKLSSEQGSNLVSPDLYFRVAPVPVNVYLQPGGDVGWSGTLTPLRAGTYLLLPGSADASYISLPLPPLLAESPAGVRLVVRDSGPVDPPIDPSTPAFADVSREHPAFAAIQLLAQRGLVSGYPDVVGGRPLFRPDLPVSRAQFAKMIVGALGLPVSEADVCPFTDVPQSGLSGLYPDNFVAVAAGAGLTLGVSVTPPLFDPYGNVTRMQAGLMAERADPSLDDGIPGDPWAAATRGEVAVLLAKLLRPQ